MSRIAKNPVKLPKGVELSQDSRQITVKGSKGALTIAVNPRVVISQDDNVLTFAAANGDQNSKPRPAPCAPSSTIW